MSQTLSCNETVVPGSSGNISSAAAAAQEPGSETKDCGSDMVLEVPPDTIEESQLQQLWETLTGLMGP